MEFYSIEEFVCPQLDRDRQETGDYLTRENNSRMWNKVFSFKAFFFGEIVNSTYVFKLVFTFTNTIMIIVSR